MWKKKKKRNMFHFLSNCHCTWLMEFCGFLFNHCDLSGPWIYLEKLKDFLQNDLWVLRYEFFVAALGNFFPFPATYEVVCSPSRKWDVRGERKRDMRGFLKNIYIKLKDYFNKRSCKIKSGM